MGNIVKLEEVKAYAGVKRDDHDTFLETLIGGAERFVQRRCERRFAPDPPLGANGADTGPLVTKSIATRGLEMVRIPDLRVATVTAVSLGGVPLQPDYGYNWVRQADGDPAHSIEFAYTVLPSYLLTPGHEDLVITGRWGWNPQPEDIKDAICQLVARRFKKRDANWADSVQTGPESATFTYSKSLPAEVKETIDFYTIPKLALV